MLKATAVTRTSVTIVMRSAKNKPFALSYVTISCGSQHLEIIGGKLGWVSTGATFHLQSHVSIQIETKLDL